MKKRKRKTKNYFIWLFVIALFALFCDSRFRLQSTVYELSYDDLPGSFDGFRIVQISDLHTREFGDDNGELLEKVAAQKPDLIVLTGDLINRTGSGSPSGQSEKLRGFLSKLAALAPCYFVSGNHEWAGSDLPELSEVLDDCGVRYLRNEYLPLERGGESIILAGVEDPNGPADMKTPPELVSEIRAEHPDNFILLLGHRNDWLKKYPDLDVDLILCGHAHGGVWRIPGVGGLVGTERDLFPDYTEGVYNEGGYNLVVSRGLGDASDVPRLLNNPELVTVVLKAE